MNPEKGREGEQKPAPESKDLPEITELIPVAQTNVDAHRRELALKLLDIFKIVVLIVVIGSFVVTLTAFALIAMKALDAATAVQLVKDGIVPLFAAAASFSTSLFGQLLAFVLGFYFGGKMGK
jgi:hypothetical protein